MNLTPQQPRAGQERQITLPAIVSEDVLVEQAALLLDPPCTRRAIASEQFIKKSAETYGPQWLAREIDQNFLDHNPGANRGTLNGVRFAEELLETFVTRFTVAGDWPFRDPTPLLNLDSAKPDGVLTAGGNAIGLKQTVIRLMRDFGCSRFDVVGDGWTVCYSIAKKGDINALLEAAGIDHRVSKDWLVADRVPSARSNTATYVIEIDDPRAVAALRAMPEFGVSDTNPRLQDLDYRCPNGSGALKWLPPEYPGAPLPQGNIFLNGQIVSCQERAVRRSSVTSGDDWSGSPGFTLVLNDIDYKMSIDRPPLSSYDIELYAGKKLIKGMSRDDLIRQLEKAVDLWPVGAEERFHCYEYPHHALLELLVNRLHGKFKVKAADVPVLRDGKWAAATGHIPTAEQMDELRSQGYSLIPAYFGKLGVPSFSEFVTVARVVNEREIRGDTEYRARHGAGLEVAFRVPSKSPASPGALGALLRTVLDWEEDSLKIGKSASGSSVCITIAFPRTFRSVFLSDQLISPVSPEEQSVLGVRGAIFAALKEGLVSEAFLSSALERACFSIGKERPALYIKVESNDARSPRAITLRFASMGHAQEFSHGFRGGTVRSEASRGSHASALSAGGVRIGTMVGVGAGVGAALLAAALSIPHAESNSSKPVSAGGGVAPPAGGSSAASPSTVMVTKLRQLIAEMDSSGIAPGQRVPAIYSAPEPHKIPEDFAIVAVPTGDQIQRLDTLKRYFEATTGVPLDCPLFFFAATGLEGINQRGTAIGLHVALCDVPFEKALTVLLHEVAHSAGAPGHEADWQAAVEALTAKVDQTQNSILAKLQAGEQINGDDRFIIAVPHEWNRERLPRR